MELGACSNGTRFNIYLYSEEYLFTVRGPSLGFWLNGWKHGSKVLAGRCRSTFECGIGFISGWHLSKLTGLHELSLRAFPDMGDVEGPIADALAKSGGQLTSLVLRSSPAGRIRLRDGYLSYALTQAALLHFCTFALLHSCSACFEWM